MYPHVHNNELVASTLTMDLFQQGSIHPGYITPDYHEGGHNLSRHCHSLPPLDRLVVFKPIYEKVSLILDVKSVDPLTDSC